MARRDPASLPPAERVQPLAWPLFAGLDGNGRLAWRRGHPALRDTLLNILLTRPGERLLRPDFGAGLRDYLHHPNSEGTRALIADVAARAIARLEPRLVLEEVRALPDPASPSRVLLSVRYRLRATGEPERFDLALQLGGAADGVA
jgi:hypothetical protein